MAQSYKSPESRKALANTLRFWANLVLYSSYILFALMIIADIILLFALDLEDFFWVLFIVVGSGAAEIFLAGMTSVVIAAIAEMTEAAYNFNEREYAAQKEIAARNEELRRQQLEEERLQEEKEREEQKKAEKKAQEKAYVYTMDDAVCPFCANRTYVSPTARFAGRGFCGECGRNFVLSKACEPKY